MISVKQIASDIQEGLNAIVEQYPLQLGDNDQWVFEVCLDKGTVKPATREDNLVTHYIMGQVSVLSSEYENAGAQQSETKPDQRVSKIVNVNMSIGIEFLVPIPDIDEAYITEELSDEVRKVIDTYFALTRTGTIVDDDNITYSYSVSASVGATGARDMRHGIGDSISIIVGADYSYTMNGINSRALTLTVDGIVIDWLTLGIMRQSDQEPALVSDQSNAGARAMLTGTTLSINFTRLSTLMQDSYTPFDDYLFDGEEDGQANVAHLVTLSRPSYINASGQVVQRSKDYFMTFTSGANNAMQDANMSESWQLQEADMSVFYPSAALATKYPNVGLQS